MKLRKKVARALSRLFLLRWCALAMNKMLWVTSRAWSHFRFRALVPQAGDAVCHWTVELKKPENLTVGDFVRIGPYAVLGAAAPIILEDHVIVSRGAVLETAGVLFDRELPYPPIYKPIKVERGAWIATGAIVLGGVTIGERAMIGAGAVVSRDVPAYAIVNPAANRILARKPKAAAAHSDETH
jgi:putative colanic acid biosynthesis acetyltransferase WcaF